MSTLYWEISRISELLLQVCEKDRVRIWAGYEALVGLIRYSGVIPNAEGIVWCVHHDEHSEFLRVIQETFLEHVQQHHEYVSISSRFEIEHGVFNDAERVRVFFYKEDQDQLVVTPELEIPNRDDIRHRFVYRNERFPVETSYRLDQVLPLVHTTFLGHRCFLPRNSIETLSSFDHNWQTYKRNGSYDSFFDRPAVLSLPQFQPENFQVLLELLKTSKTPFCIRNSKLLHCSEEQFQELIRLQVNITTGYGKNSESIGYRVGDIWQKYQQNKLDVNIVDSPIDSKETVFTREWIDYAKSSLNELYENSLTWIFTNEPKLTEWHTDPDYGFAFMKLIKGEKIWWLVSPEEFDKLESNGFLESALERLTLVEILKINQFQLFGKVFVHTLKSNDELWFPFKTLHKVFTTEHSHGIGGYLRAPN
jgi:hypothetical protein